MRHVRGRIVDSTSRVITTASGVELLGRKARGLFTVRNTRRWLENFRWHCRRRGLDALPIQGSAAAVFDVAGPAEQLDELAECKCIQGVEFVLDVRPPFRATGGGAEKKVVPLWKERLLAQPEYSRDEVG